jgi:hypothetical protein
MAEVLVFTIIFSLGFYLFICFVSFRIGEKFGIGSLFEYCIPIYNGVLLCRCADISGWNVLWLVLPGMFFKGQLQLAATLITIIFSVVLWGRIAERMGRSFWQYGLGSALLGIPVFVLAFGSARPASAAPHADQLQPLPDHAKHQEPLYKPLSIDAAAPASHSSVGLYCLSGEFKGNTIPVTHAGVVIGRDPKQAQLVFSSNEVSRTHTRVSPDMHNLHMLVISDLQSTNGTYHLRNGDKWERINGSVVLGTGKRFKIAKDVAEFEVR